MLDREKIISRVRKLLAMSEDTSSPNEATIAASRAAKLMQQYNLDNASILLDTLTDSDIVENNVDSAAGQRIPRWIMLLLVPVANLHDCKVRYVRNRYHTKVPQFIGTKEDCTVAGYVFEYLVNEIKRQAKLYQPLNQAYGYGRKGMNDFKDGASCEVQTTLKKLKREKEVAEQTTSTGTGLVVCKMQLIEARYNIKYGSSHHYKRQSEARQMGERAGANISIRDGITGTQTARIE